MKKFSKFKEYTYIVSESKEISNTLLLNWTGKFMEAFPALKYRNYKLYFLGQFISLIGSWLQVVAQGWLVLQLTNSAFWVGFIGAAASIPTLIFSLHAGVIVDRFDKKYILIVTQTLSLILAFILAILTLTKVINIQEIIILTVLMGTVNAMDSPARQAFVVEMVGKEDMSSAIALNSGVFNGARVVGPAIAGILIAFYGVGGAFMANALSYIAAIISLIYINPIRILNKINPKPIHAIKEGIIYTLSHENIKSLLVLVAMTSILGFSYSAIMPIIAKDVYHQGAGGLGYLYVASGIGALAGTVVISAFSKKLDKDKLIIGGSAITAVCLLLISFVTNMYIAMFFLVFIGFGLIVEVSMINSTIQHTISDGMRGRVMSIYTLVFIGTAPFGNLQIGFLADKFGSALAVAINAIIFLLYVGYISYKAFYPKLLLQLQTE